MSAGGYFAGGIFDGLTLVKHKTLRRYTVRRQQGGTQSTKDNQSGTSQPHSMGAYIRRQNAVKLRDEIAAVLTLWKKELSESHFVFLSAPGANKFHFFYENSPMDKQQSNLKYVPITTKRPTMIEVKRIFEELTTVQIIEKLPEKFQKN